MNNNPTTHFVTLGITMCGLKENAQGTASLKWFYGMKSKCLKCYKKLLKDDRCLFFVKNEIAKRVNPHRQTADYMNTKWEEFELVSELGKFTATGIEDGIYTNSELLTFLNNNT